MVVFQNLLQFFVDLGGKEPQEVTINTFILSIELLQ